MSWTPPGGSCPNGLTVAAARHRGGAPIKHTVPDEPIDCSDEHVEIRGRLGIDHSSRAIGLAEFRWAKDHALVRGRAAHQTDMRGTCGAWIKSAGAPCDLKPKHRGKSPLKNITSWVSKKRLAGWRALIGMCLASAPPR